MLPLFLKARFGAPKLKPMQKSGPKPLLGCPPHSLSDRPSAGHQGGGRLRGVPPSTNPTWRGTAAVGPLHAAWHRRRRPAPRGPHTPRFSLPIATPILLDFYPPTFAAYSSPPMLVYFTPPFLAAHSSRPVLEYFARLPILAAQGWPKQGVFFFVPEQHFLWYFGTRYDP